MYCDPQTTRILKLESVDQRELSQILNKKNYLRFCWYVQIIE